MINDYRLIKKLGEGCTAQVYEAIKETNQRKCAIKIFTKENDSRFLKQVVRNEVNTAKHMQKHKNLMKMLSAEEEAILEEPNGEQTQVSYITSQLYAKGELFYYLAGHDGLPANICRYYGKQILDAVHCMHSNGVAHRDLKCENILLDGHYNLKISDFGFACQISGSNGRGYSNDQVGTKQYMAPEILMGIQYNPQTVDLFALGVIFFMLYTGRAPFVEASQTDPHFKLLAMNDTEGFWRAHGTGMEPGFFTDDFKNLITQMLAYQPFYRLSMVDVIYHPFFQNGDYATPEQVRKEMRIRDKSRCDK